MHSLILNIRVKNTWNEYKYSSRVTQRNFHFKGYSWSRKSILTTLPEFIEWHVCPAVLSIVTFHSIIFSFLNFLVLFLMMLVNDEAKFVNRNVCSTAHNDDILVFVFIFCFEKWSNCNSGWALYNLGKEGYVKGCSRG